MIARFRPLPDELCSDTRAGAHLQLWVCRQQVEHVLHVDHVLLNRTIVSPLAHKIIQVRKSAGLTQTAAGKQSVAPACGTAAAGRFSQASRL